MNYTKHLLKISDLTSYDLYNVIDLANGYLNNKNANNQVLKGKTVVNLFFEDSTRTSLSFEIAAKTLGANVVNLPLRFSSLNKGESIKDMIKTLNAMDSDFFVIRHKSSGIINTLSQHIKCSIINAGDGSNEHPSQALIDYLVISHHKKQIKDLKIVICGDIIHSRVARSNIRLLSRLGAKITLVAPPTLVIKYFPEVDSIYHTLSEGIHNADVIMLLRLQKERMSKNCFFPSEKEYFHFYGLNSEKLLYAKPDVIVMHPGPVNRGVEIGNDVSENVILQQVKFGVAIRKAIFNILVMK
ncbi:MAG: aspartate carbamoyltransferase catalytic subunit [Wolbachia endosymbiont of Fragariocoptes setiger]|nr:aspartate carbamoyltransferase catalytic subunit [Wolbachia endosymbiont of Fragariocoptes setiger]